MENYKIIEQKLKNLETDKQPKKKVSRRTFNLEDDLYKLLGIYSEKKKISRSKALNEILENFFNSMIGE